VSDAAAIDRERYVSLATYRRDGREVATPVWIAGVDGLLYVVSFGEAGKVKRVRSTPRVRVAPCDARGAVTGAWQEAVARIVTDERTIERARAALREKYGWQFALLSFGSWLTGRNKRRAWIEVAL
jgi:PPOX class probable F420-dependent enzyme